MEANLKCAGLAASTSSLVQLRSMSQHLKHFATAGWLGGIACDMWTAHQHIQSAAQRQQANHCELLDELEEFVLIMRHCCFLVASTRPESKIGQRLCTVQAKNKKDDPSLVIGFPKVGTQVREA